MTTPPQPERTDLAAWLERTANDMLDWTGEAKSGGGEFARMALVCYTFGIAFFVPVAVIVGAYFLLDWLI